MTTTTETTSRKATDIARIEYIIARIEAGIARTATCYNTADAWRRMTLLNELTHYTRTLADLKTTCGAECGRPAWSWNCTAAAGHDGPHVKNA